MTQLAVRFLIISLFIVSLTVLLFSFIEGYTNKLNAFHEAIEFETGTINLFDSDLSSQSQTSLKTALKESASYNLAVIIVPFSSLSLSASQVQKLKVGQWVYYADILPDNDPDILYKLTPNPNYVYKLFTSTPDPLNASFYLGAAQFLIESQLKNIPQTQWHNTVAKLSKQFGFPLSLISTQELNVTPKEKLQLKNYGWTTSYQDNDLYKQIAYAQIPNTDFILKYGPIVSSFQKKYKNTIIFLGLLIFIELITFIVAFMFENSLRKLNLLANEYGRV